MLSLVTSHTLVVPNGTLYYEVRGSGPLLVLIPGANGEASLYNSVALELSLSRRFRVVTYDRRGYSRSTYTVMPDESEYESESEYETRVFTDVDDVARLIRHLSPDAPATVFGSNTGAIVALTLLARHSDLVRTLVAHEPPAFTLLPDGEQIMAAIEPVYDEFRRVRVQAVMGVPLEVMGTSNAVGTERSDPHAPANLKFWMENELRQYPRTKIDVESLKEKVNQLLLAGGRDGKNLMLYQPNMVLAERTGTEVIDLPGGHLGYKTHPKEFAAELLMALEMRSSLHEARTTKGL